MCKLYKNFSKKEAKKRGWCEVCREKCVGVWERNSQLNFFQEHYDEYSKSAWKSLAIKSLRIGWVQGLEVASNHLSKSEMSSLLIGGLFEDVFPAGYEELEATLQEIRCADYYTLCTRDTHHNRGYTDLFCDMETEAVREGRLQGRKILDEISKYTSLKWVNPRVYNCLYTWYIISPQDRDAKREVLNIEFVGMPSVILDGHTLEGKQNGQRVTLLSGHYFNHRKIARVIEKEGWEGLRRKFIESFPKPVN